MEEKFEISLAGLSRDLRTNKWNFVCKACKKQFSPQTTMLAVQHVECPKCGASDNINYNEID